MNYSEGGTGFDLICLSHLRWDFVYQRPQHLMTGFATTRRVFYVEEPVWETCIPYLEIRQRQAGVRVVVPHMPRAGNTAESNTLRKLLDRLIVEQGITSYCLWYYTPMALNWTAHLKPLAIVYDCMDELSAFQGAAPELREREATLLKSANVVFTGGYSLFETKRSLHSNVYPFPSSIDLSHFAQARYQDVEPHDQSSIPTKRIGYCGVIDERMDLDLVREIADSRRDWNIVMIGPVVKIRESELPRAANIHYLGMKKYDELPAYISGWDAAILPFARNESTRFISPTKTPEYLAAGRPVVSTSIADVIRPYGTMGLVHIADDPKEFIGALENAMAEDHGQRIRQVDAFLSRNSWSRTWRRMAELVEDAIVASARTHAVVATTVKPVVSAAAASGAA
ncbi:MAG: glycosyltransferase family 1 protein [Terriglobales bacterium]